MRPSASLIPIVGLLAAALAGLGVILQRGAAHQDPRAVLERSCIGCHDSAERAGGLALDRLTLADVHANVETWEHVVRKVRTGFMPPAGEPRPERRALDGFAAALEQRLDAAESAPNAGFKGVSRLNRAEYANAIRDLLATTRAPSSRRCRPMTRSKVSTTSPRRSRCRRRSSKAT
jgi:hypothetical protein